MFVFITVGQQTTDNRNHLVAVEWIEVGGCLAADFGVAAAVAGRNHLPAGHMLQDRQAKALVQAGLDSQRSTGNDGR